MNPSPNHPTSNAARNPQQKIPFGQYYRTPSANRKLQQQALLTQQSPRDPKGSFDNSPYYKNNEHSPLLANTSHYISTQHLKTERNLFPPLPPANSMTMMAESNAALENFTTSGKEQVKPKIVFSYSRKNSIQTKALVALPSSCGTSKNI